MHAGQTTSHEPERPPSPTRWQVAVHEAAHAVYAHRRGIEVSWVTIEGIVALESGNDTGNDLGWCSFDFDGEGRVADLVGCTSCLVGKVAEREAGGFGRLPPYPEFVRLAEASDRQSDDGVVQRGLRCVEDPGALYERAREEAQTFVRKRWDEIVALAEKVVDEGSLDSSGVSAMLGPGWLAFREMLDELAYENDIAPWVKAASGEPGPDG